MYITKARKYHKDTDGKYVAYDYFRLTRKRCGSITVRQSTEAEERLSAIYSLLDINPNPIGKNQITGTPKVTSKKIAS